MEKQEGTWSKMVKWANEQQRARLAPVVVKQYKKGDFFGRKITESSLLSKGYFIYSEEEIKQFSGGKALALGVVFLPLALLGSKNTLKLHTIFNRIMELRSLVDV